MPRSLRTVFLFVHRIWNTPSRSVPGCNLLVDIVIISSDGRAISAHKANLGQFSNGFPPHDGSDTSAETGRGLLERVSLQEKGDVLRLLLQFMHHTLLPDLDEVPFEVLAGLAEAAEKYGVFSAIALSKKCMRWVVFIFTSEELQNADDFYHNTPTGRSPKILSSQRTMRPPSCFMRLSMDINKLLMMQQTSRYPWVWRVYYT